MLGFCQKEVLIMPMYKNIAKFVIIILLIDFVIVGQPHVDWSNWKLLGLQGYSVANIEYSQMIGKLICGTTAGLFIVDSKTGAGNKITGVPDSSIQDIEETKNGDIYVICGDKIYYCKLIDTITPSYSCNNISMLNFIRNPQAIAVKSTVNDTLFVGFKDTIFYCVKDNADSFKDLKLLKTPKNCFGVNNPVCTDLHYASKADKLLAGGCDGYISDSGCVGNSGSLLEKRNDTTVILKSSFNVTNLSDIHSSMNNELPFISTSDSGIYYYDNTINQHCKQDNFIKAIKKHVAIGYMVPTGEYTNLNNDKFPNEFVCTIVLYRNSVYYHFGFLPWIQVNNALQGANSLCINRMPKWDERFTLFVGTNSGIYYADGMADGLPVVNYHFKNHNKDISTRRDNNSLIITLNFINKGDITLEIFNSIGKLIYDQKHFNASNSKNTFKLANFFSANSNGIYLLRLMVSRRPFYKKFCF